HYSSVRNYAGPHDGLPDVNESTKLPRSFVAVLNNDPTGIIVGPRHAAPTVDNTSTADDVENDDAGPTDIEKIIMGSTGVENHPLVRYLLQKHHSDRVIELLIQWMAADDDDSSSAADSWWTADGPPTYDGPKETPEAIQPVEEEPPNAPDASGDEESVPDKIAESLAAKPTQHKKWAARQKKAESKKRQKEMAKLKKRAAARHDAQPHSSPAVSGDAEQDNIASRMAHIYI
ncbi:hypothetical protein GGI24_004659, partial [Coemansia furcata]